MVHSDRSRTNCRTPFFHSSINKRLKFSEELELALPEILITTQDSDRATLKDACMMIAISHKRPTESTLIAAPL